MSENQIWAALLAVINAGLTARGLTATVQQGYQPTQQGVPTGATVYLYPVTGKRYGSPNNKTINGVQVQTQVMERTIQVNALSIPDPRGASRPTAYDYVVSVSDILQSESGMTALKNAGIGIIRIQDIRNPFFLDDRDRHEAGPSFDFTINYVNTRSESVPEVVGYDYGIHRV